MKFAPSRGTLAARTTEGQTGPARAKINQLISPGYLELQRKLHAKGSYGVTSGKSIGIISQIASRYGCRDILDYGCGTGQIKAAMGDIVREYDPCIPGKDVDPEPADMIVCTDVLEHIEPDNLQAVLRHLASKIKRVLFFTIALCPAKKTLDDGRNAHLIVQPAEWWRHHLAQHMSITAWNAEEGIGVEGIGRPESRPEQA